MKNYKNFNRMNRSEALTKLDTMTSNCKDRKIAGLLYKLKSNLEDQPSSTAEDLYENVDRFLIELIDDMAGDISNSSYSTVGQKLSKLGVLITKRSSYCNGTERLTPAEAKNKKLQNKMKAKKDKEIAKKNKLAQKKGVPVSSLFTSEELLKNLLYGLQDKKKEIQNEINTYLELGDEISLGLIDGAELKIQGLDKQIRMYMNERNRDNLIEQINGLESKYKDVLANRNPAASNAAFEATLQKFGEMEDTLTAEGDMVKAGMARFGKATSGGASVGGAQNISDTSFGATQGFASAAGASPVGGYSQSTAERIYKKRIQDVLDNIESTVTMLQAAKTQYDRQIERKNLDIEKIEDELNELLDEREQANASECISLDNKINSVNEERLSAIRARDRFMRAQKEIIQQLSVAENLKSVKEVENNKSNIESILGKNNASWEELAVYLKEYDEKANLSCEDMEAVKDVANSTEINRTVIPDINAKYDSDLIKDEHKFDKLREELRRGKRN